MSPRPEEVISLSQAVIDGPGEKISRRIPIQVVKENALQESHLTSFDHTKPIGISVGFQDGGSGIVLAIALVDEHRGLLIEFSKRKQVEGKSKSGSTALKLLEDRVLCRPNSGQLVGFDMGPTVTSLYSAFGLLVSNAIDLQDALTPTEKSRQELLTVVAALGEGSATKVMAETLERLFQSSVYDPEDRRLKLDLSSRAWLAQFIAADCTDRQILDDAKAIDLKSLDPVTLLHLTKLATDALRLSQIKGLETKHRVTGISRDGEGLLRARAANYKDKFRPDQRSATMRVENARGAYFVQATVSGGDGRSGFINSARTVTGDVSQITAIESVGRDRATMAEANRAATVLRYLQNHSNFAATSPFIDNIWSPKPEGLVWPPEWSRKKPAKKPASPPEPTPKYNLRDLNASQQRATNSMLAPKRHLVIVQGPPGTGKTSVIGTCVAMATMKNTFPGIYLVAQSNVAVKNIAEKLMDIGFEAWKLLVSKDFMHEWHEHIYSDPRFKDHLIRSDAFKLINARDLAGCQVILCTLSMLSNRNITKFTQHVPLHMLIVDEASQIDIGNYLSVFANFTSLRKVCFIGDDKQLPPHGEEDLGNLRSIFEVPEMKKEVIFLDTQYRMPPQLGKIISTLVYDNELQSNPLHPVKEHETACYFIDVANGRELAHGTSWQNTSEQDITIQLAQNLQAAGKKYKIITPYDPQTHGIEKKMQETEGLDWEDKCFNVDAFQGNEEDFILISLVRTRGLGFLTNLRRTNVMLTRCKKGMFIVSNKYFLDKYGGDCLVGDLLNAYEEKYSSKVWLSVKDIQEGKLSTYV